MPTLKILHTADLHIGASFASFGRKARLHRETLRETFAKIVDTALGEGVDVLLIAGDLFDRTFGVSESDISFVLGELRRASELKGIVILPGSHDYWAPGSVFESNSERFEGIPNVRLIKPGLDTVRFDGLSLSIQGRALVSNNSSEDLFEGLEPDPFSSFRVAVAHGSVVEAMKPLDDVDIRLSLRSLSDGFDYVALGHWHSFHDLSTERFVAAYSGSPELIARDQKGSGFVVLVELGGGEAVMEKRRVGRIKVESLDVDFSGIGSTDELVASIQDSVEPDESLVLSIEMRGVISIDSNIDLDEAVRQLEDSYHSVVLSGTPPPLEIPRSIIEDVPENTVAGRFVRIMLERIDASEGEEKRVYEEALQIGYQLFRGRNPLS